MVSARRRQRRRPGPSWSLGIAFLVIASAASAARAQSRDQREREAKRDCLGGSPDKGIEILADLYAASNDPTYIYNQGRCFEQNGRAAEAVTRFREYLRKATNASAGERAQVEKHITELETEEQPATPIAPAPANAAVAGPPSVVIVQTPSETPSPERARKLKLLAAVTGGVGLLAVGGGVAMGIRASALSTEVTNDANMGVYAQSKFDSGERAQTLEIVGYSVGAAALITGGILYYLAAESGAERASTVTAAIGPGGFTAGMRATF